MAKKGRRRIVPESRTQGKRVLLHVGMHETDMETLQSRCAMASGALRARGLLYPGSGRRATHPGHAAFGQALHRSRKPWSPSGPIARVVDEVRASECDRVLLSSQELGLAWRDRTRLIELRKEFEGLGHDVHVLICRRDAPSLMAEWYSTLVMAGSSVRRSEFQRECNETGMFVSRIPGEPREVICMDPEQFISEFSRGFGNENVHVVDYEPWGMVHEIVRSQQWFFGEEAELLRDVPSKAVDEQMVRRRVLEDQIVAIRGSAVWRSTNWLRSPLAHRVRGLMGRSLGRTAQGSTQAQQSTAGHPIT